MPALTEQYSAAELASLSPEERSALETAAGDDDGIISEIAKGGDEETAAAPAAAPAAGTPAAAPAADGAAAAPAAAATPAVPAAPAAAPAGAPAAAPVAATPAAAPASGPTPAPAPNTVVYRANVGDVAKEITDQKAVIKAERVKEQEALRKLNDGEIEFAEYSTVKTAVDTAVDAANDKILELNRAHTRAEVATELTAQQQGNTWQGMVREYVATAKGEGLDYAANEALRDEFNTLVRAFATEAASKGMVDDANMTASRWALDQTRQIMAMRHPKAAPAAGAPAAPAAPAAAPAGAPAAQRHDVVSLGGMPAAAAAPVADEVMAKIGTLEGEELEVYMASLPKDVYARVTAGT